MFDRQIRGKIGPGLAGELSGLSLASGKNPPLAVVAFGSHSMLTTIERNHDVLFSSRAIPFASLFLNAAEVPRLAREKDIYLLETDARYEFAPSPLPAHGPRNADVYARYKVGVLRKLDGHGIKIMVQDTGYSPHPDISKSVRVIDCTDEGNTRDFHGHGTAIVSQMAATGPYPGLVPRAHVTMARIFDKAMYTTLSRILRACAIAIEERVNVVSMSYGGPVPNVAIDLAMKKLYSAGICLVAAAGNSGPANGTMEYPAGYESVLAIAAVDKQGKLARFSSRGRLGQKPMKPDLALEGVNIVMAKSPDGRMGTPVERGYIMASGTSFACPIAASLAAMILEAKGTGMSPVHVAEHLRTSACR